MAESTPAPQTSPPRPVTTPGRDRTTRPVTDDGDHDRFAHIVFPKSKLMEAIVTGTPIQAVCGKVWVPSRNPDDYPLCETCRERIEALGLDVPVS